MRRTCIVVEEIKMAVRMRFALFWRHANANIGDILYRPSLAVVCRFRKKKIGIIEIHVIVGDGRNTDFITPGVDGIVVDISATKPQATGGVGRITRGSARCLKGETKRPSLAAIGRTAINRNRWSIR